MGRAALACGIAMPDSFDEWELLSRKALTSGNLFDKARRFLSRHAGENGPPIMWTVRHRATGLVRRLTARTELEARVKIANGLFDSA
jgi:hypothetical protein